MATVSGGTDTEILGISRPTVLRKLRLNPMVGSVGKPGIATAIGGTETEMLGILRPNVLAKSTDRPIVGRVGKPGMATAIGGIETAGKLQPSFYAC